MNIALIALSSIGGGVATILYKLYKDLISEGIHVDLIGSNVGKFPLLSAIRNDILNTKHLMDYDLVLYMGSIPWPSHVLAKLSGVPTVLFLHGFVYHELFHVILHGVGLKNRIGAVIPAVMLQTAASFNTIDLYVCHSLTACEANRISDNFVLLPQWISYEELKTLDHQVLRDSVVRIVTYTSYAASPRLLNTSHLVALTQLLKRMVNREFELIVVDPRGRTPSFDLIKFVEPMPRKEFLSLLASANLYIDLSIDEEFRAASLEAMAMGTPVAKLTHIRYLDRQDYREGDLILAHSFRELAENIAEYINNVEHYYHYYSKRCKEYVLTKRTWNAVKEPFLRALKRISRQ